MRMTRAHFRAIADVLNELPAFKCCDCNGHPIRPALDVVSFEKLVDRFADMLAATNCRFDRDKFVRRAMANWRTGLPLVSADKAERVVSRRKDGVRSVVQTADGTHAEVLTDELRFRKPELAVVGGRRVR